VTLAGLPGKPWPLWARDLPGTGRRPVRGCEGTAPIQETLGYLRFVLDLAARGLAAGVSPLEAARDTDLGSFAGWPDAERIVGNLHRAYAELSGTPHGGPIDVMAALADMVTYNGSALTAPPGSPGLTRTLHLNARSSREERRAH
jgi:cyclase